MDLIKSFTGRKVKTGKGKKGRQSAHNKMTGRYVRQRQRTTKNKEKSWKLHLEGHPNDGVGKVNIHNARLEMLGVKRVENSEADTQRNLS